MYPSTWSKLIPSEENKCPDISGLYDNLGVRSSLFGEQNAPLHFGRLSKLLGLEVGNKEWTDTLNRMQFVQRSDSIEIFLWNKEKLISKKLFSKSELVCNSEEIKLNIRHKTGIGEYRDISGLGFASGSLYLAKSIDGYLVIKETGTVVDFILLLPLDITNYTDWYRFSPVSSQKPE